MSVPSLLYPALSDIQWYGLPLLLHFTAVDGISLCHLKHITSH